ncbi:Multiple EGF-like-domain protein 3 precursor [Labilithrix luteola]|uniref:Multiple EGF-like-domain protein 3 n=1 Tax=Labilithrix luteola TaxID=1391654 RepID=A0A0K1Q5N4_9BACT|nr:hypothetical protein [Labilithrix luteola]AKV00967.1 Multiple EGF-like-domain protein 3 precursor [Labilithrix luteola]
MRARLVSLAKALALVGSLAGALVVVETGCGTKSAAKSTSGCKPGEPYYCRCADRSEGEWICNDDGQTFGTCEPCETGDNPALPPEEYEPLPARDAGGSDASKAVCGNKVVEADEDCDDGNQSDEDGCTATCRLGGSNPPASRSCPGLETHVWSDREVVYTGTTVGSPNTGAVKPACTAGASTASGAAASDRVFAVTTHKTGTLTAKTSNTAFNNLLYASTACRDRNKNEGDNLQLACANASSGTEGETLTFPVEDGKTYTVFVDGVLTAEGTFTIGFSIE